MVGNIGYPYSAVALKTRPEDVTVCEVSSFQLETVERFHPSITAILNITEDHLNRHGTMAAYTQLKARVFANQTADDTLILNYDDPALREMAAEARCRVGWFSRMGVPPKGAFVVGDSVVYGTADDYRPICVAGEIAIPAPQPGNALAAAAVAMCAEVPPPVIRHTLRTFRGVEHRIEKVRELGGVTYINDSKGTNVDSTLKAVATMDKPTVMILGGYDKHVDMARLTRAIPDSQIKKIVLIGDTRRRDPEGAWRRRALRPTPTRATTLKRRSGWRGTWPNRAGTFCSRRPAPALTCFRTTNSAGAPSRRSFRRLTAGRLDPRPSPRGQSAARCAA